MTASRNNVLLQVLAVLAGMIILQAGTRWASSGTTRQPGAGRGDISLDENCLPESIGDWTRRNFAPPVLGEDQLDGQTWSSHVWEFNNSSLSAIVSFDQENWIGWHELTCCYQMQGWDLAGRKIVTPEVEGATWPFVVANFQRDAGTNSVLVFSLFRSDGAPLTPERTSLTDLVEAFEPSVANDFIARLRGSPKSPVIEHHMHRCHQCQVFLVYRGVMDDRLLEQILDLHLASREHFREAWVDHATRQSGSISDSIFIPQRQQSSGELNRI